MPTPIRYSEAPTQYLMSISARKRQEQILQQRARLEDQKAQAALPMQLVDRMKNIETEVRDNYANAYLKDLVSKQREGKYTTADLSQLSSQYALDIQNKSQAIKQFKSEVDQALKGIDKSFSITPGNVYAVTSAYIASKIANPEDLGNGAEFISNAIQKTPELFVNRESGLKTISGIVAKSPRFTQSGVTTSDRSGNMKLTADYNAKIPFWYDMKEDRDPQTGLKIYKPALKTDKNGVVTEDVFNMFYNYSEGPMDFRTKMTIDAGAHDYIRKNNLGKKPTDKGYLDETDSGNVEIAKRVYLTELLGEISRPDFTMKSTVDKAKPTGGGGRGGASTGSPKTVTTDYVQRVIDTASSGSAQDLAGILYEMKAGNGKYEVLNAKVDPNTKGFTIEYQEKVGEDIVKNYQSFQPTSPTFEIDLASFYQKATGSNERLESRILNRKTQAKPAASTKSAPPENKVSGGANKGKLSIKKSDIPAKAKAAGYTVSEYESLLRQKGVNITD